MTYAIKGLLPNHKRLIGIGLSVNLITGWGNYGRNLVLQLQQMPDFFPILLKDVNISNDFNPLHQALLRPLVVKQQELQKIINQHQQKPTSLDFPILHSIGNRIQGGIQNIKGSKNIGIIFTEDTQILHDSLARAKQYDILVAGSTWNTKILQGFGLHNIQTCFQGIDSTIFHPAAKSNLFKDRFVIFSGGKLEYRKGQDIVVAAFKRFVSRHPEALLLTAWQNMWPQFMLGIDQVGHVIGMPKSTPNKHLLIKEWLVANGIPHNACLDVGIIPNHMVGQILREADVSVFTNRCEGGTNLVAMECLACGIPTIISANTGHLDLICDNHCYPLRTQGSVQSNINFIGLQGWGESNVEEVVEMLEEVYINRDKAREKALAAAVFMQDWTWEKQIRRLICSTL